MRVLFMSDGSDIAIKCANSISKRKEVEILALVIGDNVDLIEAKKIADILKPNLQIIKTSRPDLDPFIINLMNSKKIEFLLSIFFDHKIREPLLNASLGGGINVHPSALPHNGGCHSSFWGIIKKTPLGGTIHWLSPDLDCGSVISQKTFYDDGVMSADFIRTRQRAICAELFEENIDDLIAGKLKPGQDVKCDFHKKSDIIEATTFDINDTLTAEEFMLLGRATHHGDNGIFIKSKGNKKYKLSVKVEEVY
tara:strand:- start:510 stop:1265 length:756 start_codon:yes stop_codon:yes gene_type:complete